MKSVLCSCLGIELLAGVCCSHWGRSGMCLATDSGPYYCGCQSPLLSFELFWVPSATLELNSYLILATFILELLECIDFYVLDV